MTRRRTVLLVAPPVLCAKRWWVNRIANKPHLASLAGYVRDLAEVRILELDTTSGEDAEALLRSIDAQFDDEAIGLVGISCWTSLHYLGTLAVARRVRNLAPDVPIVVGGHHPTAMPQDFSHEICDWVVTGDGEHALRQLCAEWPRRPLEMGVMAGRPFDQSNPEHVDWQRYGTPGRTHRVLWVGASRGCAFQCRFCIEPQRGAAYSRYSVGDTLNVIERLLHSHEPSVIAFSDPLFGANRRWTEALLAGLADRDLPLMFWAETRADLMTPALLDGFKQCRFKLDFGLDTASTSMIEHMEKSASPARYLASCAQTLNHADAIGLVHGVYLIFNYPAETPETARETQRFVEHLGNTTGAMSGWLSAQSFFILPGTRAFQQMPEYAACHGTEIRHPHWWRQTGDHYALATDVLPSAAWIGREDELPIFYQWNQSINASWTSRYAPEVKDFVRDFYTGSPAQAGR